MDAIVFSARGVVPTAGQTPPALDSSSVLNDRREASIDQLDREYGRRTTQRHCEQVRSERVRFRPIRIAVQTREPGRLVSGVAVRQAGRPYLEWGRIEESNDGGKTGEYKSEPGSSRVQ
jgi:hypothetical protein